MRAISLRTTTTLFLQTGVAAANDSMHYEHEVGKPTVLAHCEEVKDEHDNILRIVVTLIFKHVDIKLKDTKHDVIEPLIAFSS